MQEIVVIDGEIQLENVLDGEVELEAITDLDPEVVIGTGGAVYPHYSGSYEVTPSSSVQTLQTTDMVMDDDVTIQAVAQGSATTPATIITADPTISVSSGGLITSTVSKTQQVTPTVIEGYVSAGTAGNVGVSGSNTQQLTVQSAQTIHPASTDQSIASGKYLTGAQTFKAVTVSGLTADKVLQGNTIKIGDADDDDRIMSVTGTASGGITPTGTKTITANGTGIDVYSYQYADVAVPNSYSASDEGKVVSNGALVAQSSDTVTANDTYDTTLINSLTVNVSGGGGYTLAEIASKSEPSGTVDVTGIVMAPYGLNRFPAMTRVQGTLATGSTLDNVFADNSGLVTACILAPSVTSWQNRPFGGCANLVTAVFIVNETYAGLNYFNNCPKLEKADLLVKQLRTNSFYNCSKLATLVLRNTNAVCILENTGVMNQTAFKSGGAGGTIYIPKALYDHLGDGTALDYKAATNWSTIDGYGTITWAKIEGSIYENAYVDGTPISS